MAKKLVEFRNIVKNFDGQIVLKGVNLDIYENEFVTLLAPAGAGRLLFCVSWEVSWIRMRGK